MQGGSTQHAGRRLPYLFGTLLSRDRPAGDTPIIAKLRAISKGKATEKDLTNFLESSGGLDSLDSNVAVTVVRYLMRSRVSDNREGRERALYKILKHFSKEELGDILRQIDGTANTRRVDHLYSDAIEDQSRLRKAQRLIDMARSYMAPRANLRRVATDWDDTVEPKNDARPIREGVAELYHEITMGKPGDVHIITACEFGAAANLKERIDRSGLEYGSVRMGDWDTRLKGRAKNDAIRSSKLQGHELMFERNPGGKWVIVCDDTQEDMRIVEMLLASEYADQIDLALILRVNPKRPQLPDHPKVRGFGDYKEGARIAHAFDVIDDAALARLLVC